MYSQVLLLCRHGPRRVKRCSICMEGPPLRVVPSFDLRCVCAPELERVVHRPVRPHVCVSDGRAYSSGCTRRENKQDSHLRR